MKENVLNDKKDLIFIMICNIIIREVGKEGYYGI